MANIDLAALQQATASCTVELGGMTSTVTYRIHVITPAWLEYLGQIEEDDMTPFCEALSQAIVSWDITSGGEPVATDAATLSTIPYRILMTIVEAITSSMESPKTKSTSFGNGYRASRRNR